MGTCNTSLKMQTPLNCLLLTTAFFCTRKCFYGNVVFALCSCTKHYSFALIPFVHQFISLPALIHICIGAGLWNILSLQICTGRLLQLQCVEDCGTLMLWGYPQQRRAAGSRLLEVINRFKVLYSGQTVGSDRGRGVSFTPPPSLQR